jgi:hypothetical protein
VVGGQIAVAWVTTIYRLASCRLVTRAGLKPHFFKDFALSLSSIPEPARVIVSVLTADRQILNAAKPLLVRELGPLDEEIGPLAFDYTSYYNGEMGQGILRWFWSFADLVDREALAGIKCLTNSIEQAYTVDGKRRFNLDPGLMTLGNFVLATGKNNAHRIYLGKGIFADLTLVFRGGTYRPLEWTYPDYADRELIAILNRLRESYKCRLMEQTPQTAR